MGCKKHGKAIDDGIAALAPSAADVVFLEDERLAADRADEPAEVVCGEGANAHLSSVDSLRDTMEV